MARVIETGGDQEDQWRLRWLRVGLAAGKGSEMTWDARRRSGEDGCGKEEDEERVVGYLSRHLRRMQGAVAY